ncbi:hypothetical protein, partial [Xanthomonas campestris]
LGAESALLHVRPLGFTDFIASAGTAQWGQVIYAIESRAWQGHLRVIQPALDNTANSLISHFGYLYVEQSELDVQYRCI